MCIVASPALFHSLLILVLLSRISILPTPTHVVISSPSVLRPCISVLFLLLIVLLVPGSSILLLELAFPSLAVRFRPVPRFAATLISTAALPDDDTLTVPESDAAFSALLPIQHSAPVPMVIM